MLSYVSPQSAMQRRFGAEVAVIPAAPSDTQLFLVIGSGQPRINGLVAGAGGKPIVTGPTWVLAELAFTRAMALRGMPGVRLVGGLSVHPDRIELLRKLVDDVSDIPLNRREEVDHG